MSNQEPIKPKKVIDGEEEFTELEKSRMENPPEHREENGSEEHDNDVAENPNQSKGV
ncbi:hypothetical protein [Pedobacter changchengzhani]|uniref:hypothetical protein n=1 Tax=Pedobacter changchengzhani TaxID=2529274 RepID=UPI001404D4A6|nr:hypothetical protein [Pedobacter changchengzhani]